MKHFASPDFWAAFDDLPTEIQQQARKNYELLKQNPRHPSLHFKKVKSPYWSARVGLDYRALAIQDTPNEYDWFWIGSHSDYDKLIK